MKCELCGKEQEEMAVCVICETRFCKDPKCGDYDLRKCKYCIEAENNIDGDMDDLVQ